MTDCRSGRIRFRSDLQKKKRDRSRDPFFFNPLLMFYLLRVLATFCPARHNPAFSFRTDGLNCGSMPSPGATLASQVLRMVDKVRSRSSGASVSPEHPQRYSGAIPRWLSSRPLAPLRASRSAGARISIFAEAPFLRAGSFTPARRAFDNPIAMASCVDCTPCFPRGSIALPLQTNSPAWVLGDFPTAIPIAYSSGFSLADCPGLNSQDAIQYRATD
jgi:hypothetical protein